MIKAVYPGSFDPVTNGHLDIIERGARVFEHLIVSVVKNVGKSPLFSMKERIQMLKEATAHIPNVSVDQFEGLLVDYLVTVDASVIIKGLRAISDFEYEFQMALMNRKLDREIETLFLMTNNRYSYLSSSLVKEVARLGGAIDDLVPPLVADKIHAKIGTASSSSYLKEDNLL